MSLEDVARRARVSAATVSRVLHNIGTVKSSTRSRVLKAIEDLKYYPIAHAQALAGGASRTLGLIVSNLENPIFLDIFRVLEQEAHSHGYEVLIANTDYDSQWLKACAICFLHQFIHNGTTAHPAQEIVITPELVVRESTGRVPESAS